MTTARALVARWICDALTSPTLPDELAAVGRLRLDMAARLSPAERDELRRMLDGDDHPTPEIAPTTVGKEGINRWHD